MENKQSNLGPKLWKKAKKLIPGGNQILSKRPERFLPKFWPTYYKKAKGCKVWDLNGNQYYDFAQMGVGACVLGYADDDVDNAVINAIRNGSSSSLNSYEEIQLSEKLIHLHPWANMCRFSKSGGEACSVAIRIARASSNKSKIVFCGYHGWQDWYIASNLNNKKNLDTQLLPGVNPTGVPKELEGTSIPFEYNDINALQKILFENKNDIAAIIMEPIRSKLPENNFLLNVKELARENNIILIFDEITSGFRMNCGGAHMWLNIEPDMAIFGKGIANGYPISAIIGKKHIMNAAQDSFISSTFWSERIGFAAALASIDKFEKKEVYNDLINYGETINEGWHRISNKYNIDIKISGIPPLTTLKFDYNDSLLLQTLYAKFMLKQGFLLGNAVYTTYAYNKKIIKKFIDASEKSFEKISEFITNDKLESLKKDEIIQMGFKRLT